MVFDRFHDTVWTAACGSPPVPGTRSRYVSISSPNEPSVTRISSKRQNCAYQHVKSANLSYLRAYLHSFGVGAVEVSGIAPEHCHTRLCAFSHFMANAPNGILSQ